MYDVIIIGGGPAGLTAGIYTLRANLKTLIIEKETIGGQISSSPLVENYPGFISITGAELSNNLYEQVDKLGGEIELEEVLEIVPGKLKKVITDYNTYEAKSIIIATGAKYRMLGLDSEEKLIGKGIHFCTSCDGAFYKNKDVAVIGGANTAVTNAIYLSNICKKVYLICRKDKLKCESALINEVEKINNIEIIYNATVEKIYGNDNLEKIKIQIEDNYKEINLDGMFISIGLDAQSDLAENIIPLNEEKYIIADNCKTNIEGIFVAGDCREKSVRQLTTAVNDGAISANLAISYLKMNR